MKHIILDCHIFDALKIDNPLCAQINDLSCSRKIEIIVTRTIAEELRDSNHVDVLERFPYRYTGNTVGMLGILRCGDSIGSGSVYAEHLGISKKHKNDALIVDAASWLAEWLVSNDRRLCKRAKEILKRCDVISFDEFKLRINEMARSPTMLANNKVSG